MAKGLQTIQRGRVALPPRLILYGQEGIGKSTFAASFPSPIFIQTEDGLAEIGADRFPLAESFEDVRDNLDALIAEPNDYRTIVVDSLDWLERLIWDKVCEDNKVTTIEAIGYGKGYTMALTYWRDVLDRLAELRKQKKILLLLAHAVAEDYTDPEVVGLKRFTPRLHKSARSLLAEYVDAVLLATRLYGAAKGGDATNPRVVRTEATPFQVAKSRYSIPPILPLDASSVLSAIAASQNGRPVAAPLEDPRNEPKAEEEKP